MQVRSEFVLGLSVRLFIRGSDLVTKRPGAKGYRRTLLPTSICKAFSELFASLYLSVLLMKLQIKAPSVAGRKMPSKDVHVLILRTVSVTLRHEKGCVWGYKNPEMGRLLSILWA